MADNMDDREIRSRGDSPTGGISNEKHTAPPPPTSPRRFQINSLGEHPTLFSAADEGIVFSQGTVVACRFEVEEAIGGGGMGLVYRVRDRLMGDQTKALKVILPSLMQSDKAQERFIHEARVAQDLGHPNIIRTYDLGEHQGIRFLTMEYLAGRDLGAILEVSTRLSFLETLDIACQILEALSYAHKTMLHRDIKPQNIFVCQDHTVKLLDFGLARVVGSGRFTQSSMAVGTAVYMAPEQLQGQGGSVQSDLYALGVVMYECLTGKLPVGFSCPLPSQVDEKIPSSIDDVLTALLNADVSVRPESAQALLEQLAAIRSSLSSAPAAPERPSTTKKPATSKQTSVADTPPPQKPPAPDPGDTKRVDLGGGVSLELVWIPPGEFTMGSPDSEEGRWNSEGPQRRVRISQGFWLGKYPVTQAQYEQVMGNNPSRFTGNAQRPVERVSWNDAQSFLERLNARVSESGFRLPSEAEWEYACRAGTTTAYYFGDDASRLGDYAWYEGNSGNTTRPVGQKRPNAWGLYDMHGNVWEWCKDDWHDDYRGAPTDGSAWVDSPRGSIRVFRGGCWYHTPRYCRSAYRSRTAGWRRDPSRGFRVALP